MKVLLEGHISASATIKDLFKQIFLMQLQGNQILHIESVENSVNGQIFIYDSAFLTGAVIAGMEAVGYAALRKLVNVNSGAFSLSQLEVGEPTNSDYSMNISLRKITENIENLPESPSSLFDQNSLLDKIFNPHSESGLLGSTGVVVPAPPVKADSIFGRVLFATEESDKPQVNWSSVEPLLSDAKVVIPSAPSQSAATSESNWRPAAEPNHTGELRVRVDDPRIERQRTIRGFVVKLIALTVTIILTVGAVIFTFKLQTGSVH
jgi:hypothetical protein